MIEVGKIYDVYAPNGRKIDTVEVTEVQGRGVYCYSIIGEYDTGYISDEVTFKESDDSEDNS